MKSSIVLVATGAMVAVATPVVNRDVVVTDVDTVVEYQTVTVDQSYTTTAPVAAEVVVTTTAAAQTTQYVNGGEHHRRPQPSTTSTSTPETTTETPVATTEQQQADVVYVTASLDVSISTEQATTTQATQVYSSTTSSATYAASSSADMQTNALYAHNVHRANHSAPELSWLGEIASYAENTANTCKFAHDMTQGSGNYGQNIAMWATSDNAAALGEAGAIGMATHDMWYNGEVDLFLPSYYGESTPDMTDFESWGHFSQLVWKDSTQLGCFAKLCSAGTMYDDMDAWFMVCNYRPAGNVGGSYGANILTSLGEATITN